MTHEVDMHARAVGAVMRVTLARLLARARAGEQLGVGLLRRVCHAPDGDRELHLYIYMCVCV